MEGLKGWDEFEVYLFDIDGTLLNCRDAVHYFAFCDALTAVAGRPLNLDGVTTHGNTDVGILRDALALGGVCEAIWRPRLREMEDAMGEQVEERAAEFRIEPTPRVGELLDRLKAKGALIGTATGNLKRIGEAKLRCAGLLARFDFGGYSDGLETRRAVFARALGEARQRAGPEAKVCVVGDTPEDVRAARACGLRAIAVATGIFECGELLAEGPDWCVGSFAELLG